jgi:hypothetical protein
MITTGAVKITGRLSVFDTFGRATVLPMGSTITVELITGGTWNVIFKGVRFTSPRETVWAATA